MLKSEEELCREIEKELKKQKRQNLWLIALLPLTVICWYLAFDVNRQWRRTSRYVEKNLAWEALRTNELNRSVKPNWGEVFRQGEPTNQAEQILCGQDVTNYQNKAIWLGDTNECVMVSDDIKLVVKKDGTVLWRKIKSERK